MWLMSCYVESTLHVEIHLFAHMVLHLARMDVKVHPDVLSVRERHSHHSLGLSSVALSFFHHSEFIPLTRMLHIFFEQHQGINLLTSSFHPHEHRERPFRIRMLSLIIHIQNHL